jgi:small subunit ribosomal protein S9
MPKAFYKFTGIGKRKTAIARAFMNEGEGPFIVNERALEEYFPTKALQITVATPFEVTGTVGKFTGKIRVMGGGPTGQAEATRHAISRALLMSSIEHRPKLKAAGLLTRDARKKERKKYGQPGARKRFQYSKR